jgi:cytochrome c-type biogenesis protein CcmF
MTLSWLGHATILFTLTSLVLGALDLLVSLRRRSLAHSRWFAGGALLGILSSVGVMEFALVSHNFSLAYVAENNSRFTPLVYSITGMWSALEGSILLWSLLLIFCLVAVVIRYRREASDDVVRWATTIVFAVAAYFLGLMAGPADPFVATVGTTSSGAGPNALLQDNPLVAIHPPLLYLGFVGFTIPFAFAVAMLITGRVRDRWPLELRRWTVLSWGALTLGIVLGAWWSYQVLGWGGFWGWDPVENASLLPWLTGTAYIHSVIVQDRRGLFRVWNLSLALVTFALTILGTFFTRSGVLQSVHAFSSSSLGPLLMGFFVLTIGGGAALVTWRGDDLRSPVGVDHPLSREGVFVANNIIFVGFAVVVLLGTAFPLLYEAINGGQVTVGTPYFATVAAPAAVVVLALMALAPAMSWRRSTWPVIWSRLRTSAWVAIATVFFLELAGVRHAVALAGYFLAIIAAGSALRTLSGLVRSARRKQRTPWSVLLGPTAGGMIVHLGVVILSVGIVSSTSFVTRGEVTLATGQSTVVAGQTLTFNGFAVVSDAVKNATELKVVVNRSQQLRPAITTFRGREGQTVGTPAIDSNFWRDVYVTFDAVGGKGSTSGAQVANNLPAGSVVLGVTVEPQLSWLWIGGIVIALGSAVTFFRRREVAPA